MKNLEETYFNIDELAKKIDMRIRELEEQDKAKKQEKEYTNQNIGDNIADLDKLIKEIDMRIEELVKEEDDYVLNIDDLTDKINAKLSEIDDVLEEDLSKTLYDFKEISKTINEAIMALEEKKKLKKQKKAMYCDMARKKERLAKKKVSNKKS